MSDRDPTLDCCADPYDRSVGVDEALQRVLAEMKVIDEYRCLPLADSLGRHLAEPVRSPIDVPAYRNSAMDGYALAASDLPTDGVVTLQVVGRVLAGGTWQGKLTAVQCLRIMTGAPMPEGCDTVVMQEQAERIGDSIRIDNRHKPGQNVRQAGEDIPRDSVVLDAGQKIGPAELGLLASLGVAEVSVRRRPRVAFFSSGDEIRSIGQPLQPGQIYDSNRYTLSGMLRSLGAEPIDLGVVPDQEPAIRATLEQAASEADLVLTSGGVSVGEADFIASSLNDMGQVIFSKVAIKPGRPLTFGRMGQSHFFGLPGNPVAVMITFLLFVRPAVLRLLGQQQVVPPLVSMPCHGGLRKLPGRSEYQRGRLVRDEQGKSRVESTGRQGSGVLSSMSQADCLIHLPPQQGHVADGDPVDVILLDSLYR